MTSTFSRLAALGAVTAATAAALTFAATAATAQPAAPRCGNGALTVTTTSTDGAAGHSGLALVYRNSSTQTCSINGYPGLDAVSASSKVLAHAGRDGLAKAGTVTIKPGGFASATLMWRNSTSGAGQACVISASINTVVANTTRVHKLPAAVGACGLTIEPTVAGTPGYPNYGPAQFDWISIASVDAQGRSMYLRDVAELLQAAGVYPTQSAQAHQLASFPSTGLSATQVAQARVDVKALDAFFATTAV